MKLKLLFLIITTFVVIFLGDFMELSKYNPLVILLYFISNIVITMVTKNPVFVIISFISAVIYSLVLEIPKMLYKYIIWIIIILALSTIINPFFNNLGETVLYEIRNTAFSFEAMSYGFITALMLICTIIWFRNYNILMSSDKFLYLFSSLFPKISLIISMILRFIPDIFNKIRDLNEAQKVLGMDMHRGIIKKLKNRFLLLGNLFSWTIEHSIQTAFSMKARGYGLKRKTHYIKYKYKLKDFLLLILILGITIFILFFNQNILYKYSYYPILDKIVIDSISIISYLLFFVLANLATLIHLKEGIKWHYLKSRICPLPIV